MSDNKKASSADTGTASRTTFGDEIIAEIPKNRREVYRIVRNTYKGHRLIDVRVWYDEPETGELRPGKGVSIKVEALPEIIVVLHSEMMRGRNHE